jgi:predicted DCC family thiol-disulfide oxidoreductase YuxK
MATNHEKPIIFFDGVCGLCSAVVDFVMAIDKKGVHLFTPLQGETAQELLTPHERKDLDSIIVYQNGRKLKKSEAVFQIFKNIGGAWGLLGVLSILPRFITDAGYGLIARYRYKLFGKKETCRLPTPQERKRFLD